MSLAFITRTYNDARSSECQICHYYEIRRHIRNVTKSCGCITITNTQIFREFLYKQFDIISTQVTDYVIVRRILWWPLSLQLCHSSNLSEKRIRARTLLRSSLHSASITRSNSTVRSRRLYLTPHP